MVTNTNIFQIKHNTVRYFFEIASLFSCLLIFEYNGKTLVNFIFPPVYAEETGSADIDGGQLYNQYCAVCHKSGLNAAPKIGNNALWIDRVQQGKETVYSNAINGLRGMPARGGYSQLSDEEVKAATDYMVGRSGGWGE